MGTRPPKPGEVRVRKGNQGRTAGPFSVPYSARLTKKGWDALVAERKVLQDLVDRGEISPGECSYSMILERALLQHFARRGTPEAIQEDNQYLADLRKRWKADAPVPTTAPVPVDLRAMIRAELASALQGELPGLLQAIADQGQATKKPARPAKKK